MRDLFPFWGDGGVMSYNGIKLNNPIKLDKLNQVNMTEICRQWLNSNTHTYTHSLSNIALLMLSRLLLHQKIIVRLLHRNMQHNDFLPHVYVWTGGDWCLHGQSQKKVPPKPCNALCLSLPTKQQTEHCTSTINFAPFTLAWPDKRTFADSVRNMTHHCPVLSWKNALLHRH